jgi:tetratricopeptide (TPR) repeat protein
LFVAAVFALHPLRVESVAWVAERKDVLSTLFWLLSLWAYGRYVRMAEVHLDTVPGPNRFCVWSSAFRRQMAAFCPDRLKAELQTRTVLRCARKSAVSFHPLTSGNYWLALVLFALGLMSKPMLVTLPFVLLLLDYWPLKRVSGFEFRVSSWRRLVLEKWPFFALTTGSCILTFIAQRHGNAVVPLKWESPGLRLENAVVSCSTYLLKTICPVDLSVIYPPRKEIPWLQFAGAAVLLATLSWWIWRVRRDRPYLFTGWLWFLGMLVPVIGLVQVGSQSMADRCTYMPQIGVFIGAVFGLADLAVKLRLKRAVLIPVAGLVLAGTLFGTARQLRFWRDSETLFEHAVAVTKDNPVAQNNLGTALSKKGRFDEAILCFRRILKIHPGDANSCNNLGFILVQKGQPDEAMAYFQEAVDLQPDFARAHCNLGLVLVQLGKEDEAIGHFQKALNVRPDFVAAHNGLGKAFLQKGLVDRAADCFRKALEIEPDDAPAHVELGTILFGKGRVDEAIDHFRKSLEIEPNRDDAHHNLGIALLQQGRVEEAMAHFEKAVQINPRSANAHRKLGDLLLRKGREKEAIAHYQAVLELQPRNFGVQNNLAWVLATSPRESVRNGAKAVELAEQADQISGRNNPPIISTLAAAYAEAGRFPEAIAAAQRALQLAAAQNDDTRVSALKTQIGRYEAGSPLHDTSPTNAPLR